VAFSECGAGDEFRQGRQTTCRRQIRDRAGELVNGPRHPVCGLQLRPFMD
jgi:hypothetical protein